MKIQKHYKITNWCQYEEVALIGDVCGLLKEVPTPFFTKEGHLCYTETWLGMGGTGWEIRSYQVENS